MSNKTASYNSVLSLLSIFSIVVAITFLLVSLSKYFFSSHFHPLDQNDENISVEYSYYLTDNKEEKVDYVLKQLADFSQTDKHGIPFKLVNQTYWISLKVSKFSPSLSTIVLHAENSMLKDFRIYEIVSHYQTKLLYSSQDNVDYIKKKIYPYQRISFDDKNYKQLLVKIHTNGPPDVPIEFYTEEGFAERVELSQLVFGCFIGIIALMAIYNLVFYFAVKNKIYLLYVGYLLTSFLTLSCINGFGYHFFSTELQEFFNHYIISLHYILVLFLLFFTIYFLDYDKDKTFHFKLSLLVGLSLIILGAATAPLHNILEAKIFFATLPFLAVYALYIVGRKLRLSFVWSRYYFISWIPLFLGATIQPMVHLNVVPSNFVASHAFLFAVMIEVIFLAFALAERMKKTEQDRLNDIRYHADTKLPRKGNLERCIIEAIEDEANKLSVVVIKPEHIEKISLYISDYFNNQFYIDLTNSLNSLVKYNDAILPITPKNEKIAFLEPYSLGMVINEDKNSQSLEELIEAIQHKVNVTYKVKDLNLPLFANIGFACYPENSKNPQVLLNEAQLASNKAIDTLEGWMQFDSQSQTKDDYLLDLAASMSDAIDNDEFEVYHQPQIDLKTLRVCGSECLIRWYYQGEGFVSPAVFIPIAEDIGLIKKLTRWVIKRSLYQHKQILDEGNKNHMISINISGRDITDKGFVAFVKEALFEAGITADKVILELTESTTIHNNQNGIQIMQELIDLGVTMSIDDFGTGYSSMSYMTQLPCQELKVDREFVEDIRNNPKNQVICETTVKMAKGLNLEVVAEGINSKSDENALREYGCDIGQGFYYAKPMPIEQYLVWLEKEVNGRLPLGEVI